MLRIVYQQLRYVAKWAWNNLNNYEHEVDFLQRVNRERLTQEKLGKNN